MLIVIPARLGSTRFPGKMLTPLVAHGGESRPLIAWTVRAALATPGATVIVATDDSGIAAAAQAAGAATVLTGPCRNGTERVAAAAVALGLADDEIVVNWQGDAPLARPDWALGLCARLMADRAFAVATPVAKALPLPGQVLALCDGAGEARDFVRERADGARGFAALPHIGMYAYRGAALSAYCLAPPTPAEHVRGLEQMRWLSMPGFRIAAVPVPDPAVPEVNEPGDAALVAAQLAGIPA